MRYISYISKIYAKSLYKVSGDSLEEEARNFIKVLENYNFLADKRLKTHLKLEILGSLDLSGELSNLFKILLQNKREEKIIEVLNAYLEAIKHERGELDVQVTSCVAIDDDDMKRISNALISKYSEVKKINIENIIDKRLLGGFTVGLRSEIIDLSIIKKLEQLKQASLDALSILN